MKKPAPKSGAHDKPALQAGDDVTWNWGSGQGHGKVALVIETDVTETIKGAKVTRHASAAKPAAEVRTDKGGKVLKSSTELQKTAAKKAPEKKAAATKKS